MKNSSYNLKVILLGAGKSERFNGVKLLAKVQNKTPSTSLIQHVLQQISVSLEMLDISKNNLYIATGGYHDQISALIGEQFSVNYCSYAYLGLGHTIAQSVEEIIRNSDSTSHIMITLADQVALTSNDYIKLIEQSLLMPDKLICTKAGSEIMPPAIFPAHYFTQLMSLTGDKGAKMLLHKNRENLEEVLLPNAGIDIDTREDLLNWHKENATK